MIYLVGGIMASNQKNKIKIIQSANKEMLDYFNDSFIDMLEEIQSLKTQLFEVDVKIDELEKTKNLYAFKSGSRKSVFTPLITDDDNTERGYIIDQQLKDLNEVRDSLEMKVRGKDSKLKSLKKRLELLNDANDAITDLALLHSNDIDDREDMEEAGFSFVGEKRSSDNDNHGYNVLMLDAFERSFYSTIIEKTVKGNAAKFKHKIDMLSYLVGTDTERARLTLKEIQTGANELLESIDEVTNKINDSVDGSKSIGTLVDDFIMLQRDNHPETIIEPNIEYSDYDAILHPLFSINILKLLGFVFDNVYTHASATRIDFDMAVSPNVVDVKVVDNGVGVKDNFMADCLWYSSLHKAKEIVHLLGGELNISGNVVKGTEVKFSFPIKQQ